MNPDMPSNCRAMVGKGKKEHRCTNYADINGLCNTHSPIAKELGDLKAEVARLNRYIEVSDSQQDIFIKMKEQAEDELEDQKEFTSIAHKEIERLKEISAELNMGDCAVSGSVYGNSSVFDNKENENAE